jgi:hypothetical protein
MRLFRSLRLPLSLRDPVRMNLKLLRQFCQRALPAYCAISEPSDSTYRLSRFPGPPLLARASLNRTDRAAI